MSPQITNALFAGLGAVAGALLASALERRNAERRTLTDADQQWMASTHLGGSDGAKDG